MELDGNKMLWLIFVFATVSSYGFGEVEAQQKVISRIPADRILLDVNSSGTASALGTERIDPLDGFKKYIGGYNITNKHYWSSAIFTGKFGYVIAALWIVSGFIYGTILFISNLCFNKRRRANYWKYKRSSENKCSIWPILLGILLTLLAIASSGVAMGGSTRFHSKAKTIKNIIIEAANNASSTIHNVTTAIQSIQNKTEAYSNFTGASSSLNSTTQRLSDDADKIRRKADKSMRILNKGLRIMNIATMITISLNLFLVLALLVSRPLNFCRISNMLIILCWFLTFLFWLYFGLYYFLNKFAGDTCAALDEYRQDPRNSTLSSILQCNDRISAKRALRDVGEGIYGIMNEVNKRISRLQAASPPGLEYVCNPFSGPPEFLYRPDKSVLPIQYVSQTFLRYATILKIYTCSTGTCKDGEFISAHDYDKAKETIDSVEMILNAYPRMESHVDCQLVRDAFSKILSEECEPLKKYAYVTWSAFATLSTAMAALLVVWIVESCHDSRYHSDSSVKPHSISAFNTSEVETIEMGSIQAGLL